MSTHTDTVVTEARAVVPTQDRPVVVPDASPVPSPPLSTDPPSRGRRIPATVASVGALVAGLALGAVAATVVANRPDSAAGTDSRAADSWAATRVSDLDQVARGSAGSLVDGTGTPIRAHDPAVGSGAGPRVPARDEVVHGTRGNLYTGEQEPVATPQVHAASPLPGRSPGWNGSLRAKLDAIGS